MVSCGRQDKTLHVDRRELEKLAQIMFRSWSFQRFGIALLAIMKGGFYMLPFHVLKKTGYLHILIGRIAL